MLLFAAKNISKIAEICFNHLLIGIFRKVLHPGVTLIRSVFNQNRDLLE